MYKLNLSINARSNKKIIQLLKAKILIKYLQLYISISSSLYIEKNKLNTLIVWFYLSIQRINRVLNKDLIFNRLLNSLFRAILSLDIIILKLISILEFSTKKSLFNRDLINFFKIINSI